ncbi:MAG: 4Fe-4S binding protein [Endomicrobiia bacterium]|nr:4Fe-4S binding protein [Endomicrobiia bacterium]
MKYPKLRELKEAVLALIRGPATTKFPSEPHTPPEGFRGRPTPSSDGCIACGACAEVCPAAAIEVIETTAPGHPMRIIEWHYDRCIYCGQCQSHCTTRDESVPGVRLTQEFDLAGVDRSKMRDAVEKPLVVCEACGEPLASRPHLEWISSRLGPLAAANFSLNDIFQQNLLPTKNAPAASIDTGALRRQDLFRINCPKCRHRVLVFNQTGK